MKHIRLELGCHIIAADISGLEGSLKKNENSAHTKGLLEDCCILNDHIGLGIMQDHPQLFSI